MHTVQKSTEFVDVPWMPSFFFNNPLFVFSLNTASIHWKFESKRYNHNLFTDICSN